MTLSQKVFALHRSLATTIAVVAFAIGPMALVAIAANRGIQWTEEVDAAFQRAGATNQVIMLHFYGDNCPPCKLLEKKTFHDPKLIAALNDNVIAVKINAEKQRELADRYQVNQWPTDVYLHPNGEEIHRRVSPQDPAVYCQVVDRVALRNRDWTVEKNADLVAKHRRQDRTLAASNPRAMSSQTGVPVEGRPTKTQSTSYQPPAQNAPTIVVPQRTVANPFASEQPVATTPTQPSKPAPVHVVPVNVAPQQVAAATAPSLQQTAPTQHNLAPRQTTIPPSAISANVAVTPSPIANNPTTPASTVETAQRQESMPAVGMDGFCPVSLRRAIQTREGNAWCQGFPEFAVRHRGRVYFCASEENRQALLQNPDHYTPAVSCYDIVHFMRTGQLIDGKCEFGCIQEDTGKVFLFADQANSEEFKRASEYYSKWLDNESQERVANDPAGATLR